MSLTTKQEAFVREYLVDLNATQAYIRAGYSPDGAGENAGRMMKNDEIKSAIADGLESQKQRAKLTADRILREYSYLAFSDVGEVIDFTGELPILLPANKIPERARRAIQSFKVRRIVEGKGESSREVEITEFRLWDKGRALDKLTEYVKMPRGELPPVELLLELFAQQFGKPVAEELGRMLVRLAAERGNPPGGEAQQK
jgi:phage terminase small subunit